MTVEREDREDYDIAALLLNGCRWSNLLNVQEWQLIYHGKGQYHAVAFVTADDPEDWDGISSVKGRRMVVGEAVQGPIEAAVSLARKLIRELYK